MRNYTHLEDYIEIYYTRLKIESPEQLEIKAVAKKLNIRLFYWEEVSQAIIYDDMNAIFLDSRISAKRQWQEFNHELCHVLTHTGDQIDMPPLFREYQEFKANNFMYHACVPTFMLDKLEIHDCSAKTINRIQELFNVEYDFAKTRIENYIIKKRHVLYSNTLFL